MLPLDALERLFDELALSIDAVGTRDEGLFLTKLVLALANQLGDETLVRQQIALCRQQLAGSSPD